MVNDRDDNVEGHEESEYHFSDDDISYDTETETPKAAPAASAVTKENFLNRLTRSKRMLISLCVFLVLVYVVYKMVAPNNSVPGTEIAPVTQVSPPANMNAAKPVATPQATMSASPPSIVKTAPSVAPPATQPQVATTQAPAAQPQVATTQPPAAQPTVTPPAMTSSQSAPTMPVTTVVATPPPATTPAIVSQPVTQASQQQVITPPVMQPATTVTTTAMPTTVAVQAAPSMTGAPTQMPMSAQMPGGTDSTLAVMAANNERMMQQLRAESTQRLAEFAAQNKTLQSQMQSLTSRVVTMEAEMRQLVQALTRSSRAERRPPPPPEPAAPSGAVESHPYVVQAIIPGRAWLKSDNGETVTVTEGDTIRGFGQVTKIDPYDGIVEVNTGNKVVSLSYGSGS